MWYQKEAGGIFLCLNIKRDEYDTSLLFSISAYAARAQQKLQQAVRTNSSAFEFVQHFAACENRTVAMVRNTICAACENRTVAMVRNTIWTISTHTAVVVVLSELQQRLAGTKPRACKYMQHVAAA